MKKKGFTLVELLAVIAILAILVIRALPNVLKMFNSAKKDLFLTEAKNVFKESAKKYISDNMHSSKEGNTYCKSKTDSKNPLDMDSNDTYYYIEKDSMGKTTKIVIWNEDGYVIKALGDNIELNSLNSDALTERNDTNVTCENVLTKLDINTSLDKNVNDLVNTSWILNDDYEFTLLANGISTSNKLSDLPGAKINFISNGKQYTGIDSIFLPFAIPGITFNITLTNNTIVESTTSKLNKIDFPFGNTIESNKGVIAYIISSSEGIYIPYYQDTGWYNNNDKTITITGGEDTKNQTVINWFKKHGERIK